MLVRVFCLYIIEIVYGKLKEFFISILGVIEFIGSLGISVEIDRMVWRIVVLDS